MSSLSQQLKAVSERNASVALDRKTRSKIHSRSLIFDAKVAAAQDYDYIFQIGCEGLAELADIDSRFDKFSETLFSETSLTFDRNVQTKDIMAQVNANLEAFINLIAPFYHLNPALKAMEWLVRRYHVNIHNAELLLLSVLPYHAQPVFSRFMNVIPKDSWPAIFSSILGYKELLKPPPASSILKCFHNDSEFFRLYSQYLVDQVRNKTVYKEMLVFYLANTVQVLASHARDASKLNDEYIPTVLEVSAELFAEHTFKFLATLNVDVKLTVYAIISVLCSVTPLTDQLVFTFTQSIVGSSIAFLSALRRQTLIVLGQLWNFYNEADVPADVNVFSKLETSTLLADKETLSVLIEEKYNVNKFLFFFFANGVNHQIPDSVNVLKFIDFASSEFVFESTASKLLEFLSSAQETVTTKPVAVSVFEQLNKIDHQRLVGVLAKQGKTLGDLEVTLMHTFSASSSTEVNYDSDVDLEGSGESADVECDFSECKLSSTDFLNVSTTDEFVKVSLELLSNLRGANDKEVIAKFLLEVFPSDLEASFSFLLRLALTPSVPSQVKLLILSFLRKLLDDAVKANSRVNFYLLVPIFVLGLTDFSETVRKSFGKLLSTVRAQSQKLNENRPKKVQCDLFMELQIYGATEQSKRSIISPQDGDALLEVLFEERAVLDDIANDASRIRILVFETLFRSTKQGKKFGSLLLKTFFLNQWSLPFWPLVLKHKVWAIIGSENVALNGTDDRFVFVDDVKFYFDKRSQWVHEASLIGVDYEELAETHLVNMVGGQTSNDKKTTKEIEWFLKALSSDGQLQVVANKRLIALFPALGEDVKLKICSELIELVERESGPALEFDPVDTLQTFEFSRKTMIALLSTVNIVTQIPEQGVAKRRRRSSSSTQKNMAKDEISSMASTHLRKLSIILDVLENYLRKRQSDLASPELLKALFKILTDLDYLGNDGKMPVLYAQETLASSMLLSIVQMKAASSKKKLKFDSNSIRADLIVNSIRLSQSPQVQNRLLLVIAELASLAPEIILHSVMPIFTFMGAHTIRQDDEFSSSALQQTISKVIPAITKASDSVDNEIEFLLTSFVTAFQHIPRHRRVKLFVSLVKTLGCDRSLHTILFLIGQQYSANAAKGKSVECSSLLDFISALLKTFEAGEFLEAISKFYKLWEAVPSSELDKDSAEYTLLSSRPVYGTAIVNMTSKELLLRKAHLLDYLNNVLASDEDNMATLSSVTLKMRVSLILFDDQVSSNEKEHILQKFNKVTSSILSSLDFYSNSNIQSKEIVAGLYDLLKSLLNLLPLSFYISSITDSLNKADDEISIKIARNFAVLAGTKLETEVNANSIDENVGDVVLDQLLPILALGIEKYDNIELVQAYLDTFASVVNKFNSLSQDLSVSSTAKFLLNSLKIFTSEKCLLNSQTEILVSSVNAITSVVNVLGVKAIGYFPKILPPALSILEATFEEAEDSDDEDEEESESKVLVQGSVLMLFACLIKKLPAFVISNLKQILKAILLSSRIDNAIRSSILTLAVDHLDKGQVLQALCNLAVADDIYALDSAADLGLYLSSVKSTIEAVEKKAATSQSSLFMKWLIKSFGFRTEYGEEKFSDNTLHSIESSFHQCGLTYVMKLNDKSFRPLFASLVRWAVSGEGSVVEVDEVSRLTAFFKFFNKLQDNLKSIITSYFSYLLDPTISILQRFESRELKETNLRRIMLHGLGSSFKYDQDDYWSHQLRFETMVQPLLGQLKNIEPSIGKHLVKTISFFVYNVSSEEYNETLVKTLVKYVSNEFENSSNTKIWTIRVLKSVFQKMGEQWLSYLPTFIPYIAELLEDDDEEVELEVRKDLVRVIERILGEPLDRYLN